ncbi:hypothetical protein ACL02T_15320 [Pseudonocardia sp. RS010]|uniref:hypothetical protein n=1 Tax=Pseudonocardia sp. RS010 TaxID=3385979 RepID=UPI0039A16393
MTTIEKLISAESVRFGDNVQTPDGSRAIIQVIDHGDEIELVHAHGAILAGRDTRLRVRRRTRVENLDNPSVVWSSGVV